jgi:hypothetical protein
MVFLGCAANLHSKKCFVFSAITRYKSIIAVDWNELFSAEPPPTLRRPRFGLRHIFLSSRHHSFPQKQLKSYYIIYNME